jgi:hypothetical protein
MAHDPQTNAPFRRIWPAVVVTCGLGLSAVWAAALLYGLFSLVLETLLGPLASRIFSAFFS